jgi:hypothetical protein
LAHLEEAERSHPRLAHQATARGEEAPEARQQAASASDEEEREEQEAYRREEREELVYRKEEMAEPEAYLLQER